MQPDSSRISNGSASPARRRGRLAPEAYIEGVLQGDRAILARTITIIESDLESDGELAAEILQGILAEAGDSLRVGITGVPGAGKSTFIDVLGMHIVRDRAEKVAVLSVDPSSPVSGGSILGDKTRMERLSIEERAFIRPSPARGHLGGVARRTRETILLCEAAGYRNILDETVGVGQSETAVRSMTDFFLLLMLAGAPLALGSWWALVLLVPMTTDIVARLLDEERMLTAHFPGFADYCRSVRYRLLPGVL